MASKSVMGTAFGVRRPSAVSARKEGREPGCEWKVRAGMNPSGFGTTLRVPIIPAPDFLFSLPRTGYGVLTPWCSGVSIEL